MPAPSKQLVVPAPRDQPHLPNKVYSDYCHRLNDKEVSRQRSSIRVLGNKSPIRKVRGLEFTAKSNYEYVPSKTIESTYCSTTPTRYLEARPVSPQRHSEDYGSEEIPSRDPFLREKCRTTFDGKVADTLEGADPSSLANKVAVKPQEPAPELTKENESSQG
ncbi:unnamed protein product [Prunus armeniaca]